MKLEKNTLGGMLLGGLVCLTACLWIGWGDWIRLMH